MDESLKAKFQKLIEYQKKDIELRKINSVLDKDVALAEKNKQKKAFNDAKQTLTDCEQQAGAIIGSYSELKKYVEDNESALAELEGAEADGEDDIAERVKKLESLRSKFQAADKKAKELDDKSKGVCSARAEAVKTGKNAKQRYEDAKVKHDALVNSKSGEISKIRAELDAIRAGLDNELYGEYSKLVDENKFPPVVPASGDDKKGMYNCGGCGLSLPQQGNTLLRERGWCRCETCHRIIVKLN